MVLKLPYSDLNNIIKFIQFTLFFLLKIVCKIIENKTCINSYMNVLLNIISIKSCLEQQK